MVTLVAVYLLILVGGIVRSTGAGMGCPDWPKCFGMWIPPTEESQLAESYKQDFVEYRKHKNIRFAAYLDALGFREKAEQVRNDETILVETEFNVTKTWTEYVNRLIGVIIGMLIIVNFIASWTYFNRNRSLFTWSLALLILVIFQGWIGSVVVSTNLLPWMVTVHMLLAILMVAILIFLVFKAGKYQGSDGQISYRKALNALMMVSGILIIIQILLGTQVREAVDAAAMALQYQDRDAWIGMTGTSFPVHRSFSILLVLTQLSILYLLYKSDRLKSGLTNYTGIILGIMVVEAIFGVIMSYFGIPPFAQPLHLWFAIILFGLQFMTILIINSKEPGLKYKTQIAV